MRIVWTTLFYLSLCVVTPGVHAATILVEASATGSILEERVGARDPTITTTYTTTNPLGELHDSFSFSSYYSTIVGHRKASVGYVVFDLSDVADDMQSVRLEMDLAYGSNSNPNLTIHALDPATALNLMANPVGTQSDSYNPSVDGSNESPLYLQLQNQYNAIGTGAQLGALSQSGPLSGIYSVDLTVTTLGLVNATDGFLALGFT
jgi:hypothetical protein